MKNRVKYFLILGIGLLLVGSIGMSYALFTVNTEKQGALNIVAGNVYCPLESSDLVNNQVTVPAQHEKVIHITLRNASLIPVHSILAYIENSNVKVYRELQSEDATELDKLDVNGTRDYRIVLRNTSNNDETVIFKGKCGLASKDLKIESTEKKIESDISIPNAPKLTEGLIPVKYDEGKKSWVKADISNPLNNLWYDYDNQMWANAVTVEEEGKVQTRSYYQQAEVGTPISIDDINTMWVWIPRYEYRYDNLGDKYAGGTKEQPGAIGINFIEGTKDSFSDQNSYKLHPAFTFGDEKINGFWYGKFETSIIETCSGTKNNVNTGCDFDTFTLNIKPDVVTWAYMRISTSFSAARKMQTENYKIYGFANDDSYDIHLNKNSEWGSVAYLSQSKYGKQGNSLYTGINKEIYQNKSRTNITGNSNGTPSQDDYRSGGQCGYDDMTNLGDGKGLCGPGASTTGTIYGVYDMNGNTFDLSMGILSDENGNPFLANSGFIKDLGDNMDSNSILLPDSKYYDSYTSSTLDQACNNGICYGHALSETEGWYNDRILLFEQNNSFLAHSGASTYGTNSGIFVISGTDASAWSDRCSRITLIP